jgi:hypothetical protein
MQSVPLPACSWNAPFHSHAPKQTTQTTIKGTVRGGKLSCTVKINVFCVNNHSNEIKNKSVPLCESMWTFSCGSQDSHLISKSVSYPDSQPSRTVDPMTANHGHKAI